MSQYSVTDYASNLVEKLTNLYIKNREDLFIEMCTQSLPKEWAKPTFTVLADLMFVDGSPCKENIGILNTTYQKLGIASEEAVSIVNAVKQLHYFDC
ncbi:MAG: hypothetical protein AAFP20_10910 [Cyanobacteria bacterium J06614_10]